MLKVSEQMKHSPFAGQYRKELEERLQGLHRKCGIIQNTDPLVDQTATAHLRGRIAEIKAMLKAFEIGPSDASALSLTEDESPQN